MNKVSVWKLGCGQSECMETGSVGNVSVWKLGCGQSECMETGLWAK